MYYDKDWLKEKKKNNDIFWNAIKTMADYYKENHHDSRMLYSEAYIWFSNADDNIISHIKSGYDINNVKDFCDFVKGYYYGKIHTLR